MRFVLSVLLVSCALPGQSLLEHSAAAAGGSVGGVAGKKVSDGLTKIFEKVDTKTQKAAKTGETKKQSGAVQASDGSVPLLEVGPGIPKGDTSNVPPPPPVRRASVHKPAPAPPPVIVETPPPAPLPPPPPVVTAADLKTVTTGMARATVLKLGEPAARISMVEDGHLLEIYRYQQKDTTLGIVRLTDGSVSNVAVR